MADRCFPNTMPDFVPENPNTVEEEERERYGRIEIHLQGTQDSLLRFLTLPYSTISRRFQRAGLDLKETVVVQTWGLTRQHVKDFTLYCGTLGTAYLLFKSFQVTHNKNDLKLCLEIVKACDSPSAQSRDVTFLCGRAGVCALGAVVAKHMGEDQLLDYYLSQFKEIKLSKDHPMSCYTVCTAKMNLGDEVDLEDYVSRPDKISTAEVAQRVISQLVTLATIDDKYDILIYLNCPGGSTYSVLAIYDCMSWIKPNVGTVCFGVVASQSVLLLAGGQKGMRYAMPNARIMIHQPQSGCGMDRASILGDAIDYLKELVEKINELHNEVEGCPITPTALYPTTPIAPVKQELAAFQTPLASPTAQPRVEVRVREGRAVNIHMLCARKPGRLLSTLRAIDNLGLDIQHAVISSSNAFALDIF